MRPRPMPQPHVPRAALGLIQVFFFLASLLPAAAEETRAPAAEAPYADFEPDRTKAPLIRQTFTVTIEQNAEARDIRDESTIDAAVLSTIAEWRTSLCAESTWDISITDRIRISLSPLVEWPQAGGGFENRSLVEYETEKGTAKISLPYAEARLSLFDSGLTLLFGKLKLEYGSNYIDPLSLENNNDRASLSEGLWLGGFFLPFGDFAVEAYCESAREPFVSVCLTGSVDTFDVGLRYRRDLAQIFSAWLSAQLGEGIIAYLETALRDNARFLDIELMPERNIGWNADFLVGFGFTPREIGASVYIEYRARSAGYSTEEYRAILSSPYWRQGALLASFPYMQSARHVIGIHLMRTGDDGPLDWSMTCMYFPPDGLDLSARAELKLFDQCSLDAELGLAAPLAGVSIGTSETALRIDVLRCSVGLQWKFSAEETR